MYLNSEKIENVYNALYTSSLIPYRQRRDEMSDYYFDRLPEEIKIDLLFKSKEYNVPIIIIRSPKRMNKDEMIKRIVLFDYFRTEHRELYNKYKLLLDWI
jgi:hypothetical protein